MTVLHEVTGCPHFRPAGFPCPTPGCEKSIGSVFRRALPPVRIDSFSFTEMGVVPDGSFDVETFEAVQFLIELDPEDPSSRARSWLWKCRERPEVLVRHMSAWLAFEADKMGPR